MVLENGQGEESFDEGISLWLLSVSTISDFFFFLFVSGILEDGSEDIS